MKAFQEKQGGNGTKKAINILSTILLILVIILAFLVAGVRLFGLRPYVVLSGSMEPTFMTGSAVYVKDVDPEDIEVGDIITFSIDDGNVATHRVTEVLGSGSGLSFRTKGDANDVEDASPVSASQVQGRALFSIPYLGRLLEYIHTSTGRITAIAVGAAVVLLVALPEFIYRDGKKAGETNAGKTR